MLADIDTIFFPTDFSENANQALPFAAELALKTEARLSLLYCLEEPFDFAPMLAHDKEKLTEKVSELFEQQVAGLRRNERFKELKIDTSLLSGQPLVNILDEAHNNDAGLMVMGTKGATGSRKLLFGSFTTETILHSNIPVLAIPEGSTFNQFKQIVFTTDFHEDDLNTLNEVLSLARLFKSTLRVVHVAVDQSLETEIKFRGFRDLVRETHPEADLSFDLVREFDFFSGIADYLDRHPVDLLAMVRYKKTFWESLVSRSFSKEMGFYTKVPLLVMMGGHKTK